VPASPDAYAGAYRNLLDGLGSAFRSLQNPDCTRLLGPLVPGATMTQGARVPGTSYELDPVMAAFNLGTMMGWAGGAAYPADKLAAILPVADYLARKAHNEAQPPLCIGDVLTAMIEAQQMPHGAATAAVVARLLGGSPGQVAAALGMDRPAAPGAPAPRWTAGDAAAHAVRLAFMAMRLDGVASPPAGGAMPACATGADAASTDGFAASVAAHFSKRQAALICSRVDDRAALSAMPVHEFMALLVKNG
jgi:2-methylcitrate dehydratase